MIQALQACSCCPKQSDPDVFIVRKHAEGLVVPGRCPKLAVKEAARKNPPPPPPRANQTSNREHPGAPGSLQCRARAFSNIKVTLYEPLVFLFLKEL